LELTNTHIWLKRIFVVLAAYVGIR